MAEKNPKPDFYSLYMLVGEMKGTMESMNKKLDKSIEESCKRICDCEIKIEEHSKVIATTRGKISIIGGIWGAISGIGISLLIWYLTK